MFSVTGKKSAGRVIVTVDIPALLAVTVPQRGRVPISSPYVCGVLALALAHTGLLDPQTAVAPVRSACVLGLRALSELAPR